MPDLTLPADQVWRDYVTDGVPLSGNHNPAKSDIRTWGTEMEQKVDDLEEIVGPVETLGNVRGPDGEDPVADGNMAVWDGADGRLLKDGGVPFSGEYNDLIGAPVLRERLTADRTYYVRYDGNDSNDGLTDTSGGAFLTGERAHAALAALDWNGYNVTVEATGAFVGFEFTGPYVGLGAGSGVVRANQFALLGNAATITSGDSAILLENIAVAYVEGFTVVGDTAGIKAKGNTDLLVGPGMVYGACGDQVHADLGAHIELGDNYTINDDALSHIYALRGGNVQMSHGIEVTLTGTPAFTDAFAVADHGEVRVPNTVTFTGGATGARALAKKLGLVDAEGGGAEFLPGDSAVVQETGGVYVP